MDDGAEKSRRTRELRDGVFDIGPLSETVELG
jgi:hypothetical protein